MMNINKMMNNVIKNYGFESNDTINFCKLCEDPKATEYVIYVAYSYLMKGRD